MEWIEVIDVLDQRNLKSFARSWLTLLRSYFRIEVEGLEHIPLQGAAIIAPNHSGFAGADAALLVHIIKRETRRRPRILAHRAYFDFSAKLKDLAESFGLRRASYEGGLDVLKKGNLLVLFPEGETGNFKSTLKRYELQPFHRGFIRMALDAGVPIIPCVIVGAEEANLNLGNINLGKWIKGLRIPLPLNFIPLPSKWLIRFLPPVPPDYFPPECMRDPKLMKIETRNFQAYMQKEIRKLVRERPFIYSERVRGALNWAKDTALGNADKAIERLTGIKGAVKGALKKRGSKKRR